MSKLQQRPMKPLKKQKYHSLLYTARANLYLMNPATTKVFSALNDCPTFPVHFIILYRLLVRNRHPINEKHDEHIVQNTQKLSTHRAKRTKIINDTQSPPKL